MATPKNSWAGLDSAIASVRYSTDNFAAISSSSASNLARIFNIPTEQIQFTADVKLLHRTEFWAWWSDNKLTTCIGLPENYQPKSLSPCAEKLIQKVCLSASGRPNCGWKELSKVERVVSTERIAVGSGKLPSNPETLDRLIVKYVGGEQGVLYALFSTENTESYFYQLSTQLPVERLKRSTISRLIVSIEELQPHTDKQKLTQAIAA